MTLQISSTLAITSTSIPPMTLVERSMINPKSLTTDQYQQVMGFQLFQLCFKIILIYNL